jgi:hypothetical protein
MHPTLLGLCCTIVGNVHAISGAPLAAADVRTSWSEFHRINMERWNPYETTLNVRNVGG